MRSNSTATGVVELRNGRSLLWWVSPLLSLALTSSGCGGLAPPASGEKEASGSTAEQSIVVTCPPGYTRECTCGDDGDPCGGGIHPMCWCDPPPPPPPVSGTIVPAFLITHVIYAPPGRSSKIAYSETSTVGTTVTNTQSFKREVKVSAELSGGVIFGNTDLQITVGNTWGNSRAEATDLAVETVRGYTANGQTDGIDHNWDEIWFLMQPLVNITYQPAGVDVSQPASARWHLAPNQDGFSNAVLYYAQVGWLNGAMPMPDDVRRTLDAFHITSEYYSDLLSADPPRRRAAWP